MATYFDYSEAFSRNLGWVTEEEQETLKKKCVAIAGLGGVGGVYLITLVRLGIERFHVADFDHFEIQNFNRQYGANTTTLNQSKVDVMVRYAKEINPNVQIQVFNEGVTQNNLANFLDQVDIYADGIDIFCMDARNMIFRQCAEKGIPAVTVAPLGMGAALATYLPGKTTYEDYFQLEGLNPTDQVIHFVAGMTPRMLHMGYLADPSRVNLEAKKGPSTINGCQMCAGVCGTEVVKILLKRKGVVCLPTTVQYDAYKYQAKKSWRPWGNRNPLQKLLISFFKWNLSKKRIPK